MDLAVKAKATMLGALFLIVSMDFHLFQTQNNIFLYVLISICKKKRNKDFMFFEKKEDNNHNHNY